MKFVPTNPTDDKSASIQILGRDQTINGANDVPLNRWIHYS